MKSGGLTAISGGTRRKFHTEYLPFKTKRHREYFHITREVEAALKTSRNRAEFDGQRPERVSIKIMGE